MPSITTQGVTISFDNEVKPYPMHPQTSKRCKHWNRRQKRYPTRSCCQQSLRDEAHAVHCPPAPYPAAAGCGETPFAAAGCCGFAGGAA